MAVLMRAMSMSSAAMALAALTLGGCAVERGEGLFEPQSVPEAGPPADMGADAEPDGAVAQPLSDPAGTWMLFVEDRNCLVGTADDVESIIWSWYVIDIGQPRAGSASLQMTTRICRQELSPLAFGFLSIVPDEVPDATGPKQATAFLVDAEPGSPFFSDTIIDYWGVQQVADDEAMPAGDDPRYYDQEEDGNIGVTFPVRTRNGADICQVYVGQRVRVGLEGEVVDAAHVRGAASTGTDKVILAASTDLCASGDVLPNDAPNTFDLVRIDGADGAPDADADGDGTITCTELRDALPTVMPAYGLELSEPDPATWCP